jgi:hypothetical protein
MAYLAVSGPGAVAALREEVEEVVLGHGCVPYEAYVTGDPGGRHPLERLFAGLREGIGHRAVPVTGVGERIACRRRGRTGRGQGDRRIQPVHALIRADLREQSAGQAVLVVVAGSELRQGRPQRQFAHAGPALRVLRTLWK